MQLQLPDPRNEKILVYIDGELLSRDQAKVSVFDSVVQGGDAVWEGLRLYQGKIFQLEAHLQRLVASARAMAFTQIPSPKEIKQALFKTLKANRMEDGVHIRLTLTRGKKITSGMDPRLNTSGPTLIILPEWKPPVYPSSGIRLITASVRRNSPQCIDSKIHHNNLINNILAKIEANVAGADDALMLDLQGYVAETNATNVFVVRNDQLFTPHADSCLPGITRSLVVEIAKKAGIPVIEKNLTLAEVYAADECFTTGTMGELTPVLEVDGRKIGDGTPGPLTRRLRQLFAEQTRKSGEPIDEL
ncbi:MAG: aminotransferase IV [Calditrichaeota bacterium]|nr:MAG: aminotransferase IV [Calditrichota bacterium]